VKTRDKFFAFIGLLGYGVWAVMAYFDPAQRSEFLHITSTAVMTTAAIVLRDMQSSKKDGDDADATP
jgi:hypothetical protein